MEWQSVTFDWNALRAFLVTAEEGSLSAAGRALGLAQPTVGRQVAALERELGVALFERTGRGQALTPAGLELLEHARTMGEGALRLSLAASGQSQSIEGKVVVTAGESYAAFLLPPMIARLRRDHPGIEIEVVSSNALSDLRRREADIAIRNVRPTDPDLVARLIREDRGQFYATHDYLSRLGNPTGPEGFSQADFIGFGEPGPLIELLTAKGFEITRANIRIHTESHLAHWGLVCAGAGIGVMTTVVGDAEPRVRRILPDLPDIPFPVWLTAHREVQSSRRIRLVFDRLAEELAAF